MSVSNRILNIIKENNYLRGTWYACSTILNLLNLYNYIQIKYKKQTFKCTLFLLSRMVQIQYLVPKL